MTFKIDKPVLTLAWMALMTVMASATISVPNVFSPFTTIQSSQVNTNFSTIASEALDKRGDTMTGTLTTQALIADANGTRDLGSAGVQYRNGWFNNNLTIANAIVTTLVGSGSTNTIDVGTSGNNFRDGFYGRDLYYGRNVRGPAEFDNGNSGTTKTIDFSANGPVQKVTRTGSATYTLTAPPTPGFVSLKFVHEASATAYTVAFSPSVKFAGGTAPTFTNTSGAIDMVTFYWDGATFFGSALTNMQ